MTDDSGKDSKVVIADAEKAGGDRKDNSVSPRSKNNLREIRIENMMSKAELARKAGLSVLTITRIEAGYGCRMDTKRKILKALGLKVTDRRKVFEDD
ncbi:MAG: helix-turn-helix transcriptional regulator [Deltaproteobacteria bacterium]|nr:helix-turn-helix transcriptional regulator [Deltaproteobacteria bacterium]